MVGVVEGTPEGSPEEPKDDTLTPTKPPGSQRWALPKNASTKKKAGIHWDADPRYAPEGSY